jgi:hypothetical protein
MRKEVERLLEELATHHGKRTLLALWADIRGLSRKQFEELIAGVVDVKTRARPSKRRAVTKEEIPDDTPEGRIGHVLLTKCRLSPERAAREMRNQLLRQGVDPARVPPYRHDDFQDWLRLLFRSVPAGRVMHGALQIEERPRRDGC